MRTYVVRAGEMTPGLDWARDSLGDDATFSEMFATATGGSIGCELQWREKPILPTNDGALTNDQLPVGLIRLLGDAINKRPVSELALLFANSWGHNPNVYGMMFDADIDDPVIGVALRDCNGIPRQGCVVFIDALKNDRFGSEYIARTAFHELGHVFNLEHDTSGNSIMTQTSRDLTLSAFTKFSASDRAFLSKIDDEQHGHLVQPGGAAFGTRGSVLDTTPTRGAKKSRKRLQLLIDGLPKSTYLPAEPIILDVRLQTRGETNQTYELPNELDPGYGRFRVWVEMPNGERLRYRPLNRYCAKTSTVAVDRRKPMTNNINLFWGAGGLTCTQAGAYEVVCEYQLTDNPSTILRSNTVAFEIRSLQSCNEDDRLQSRLLTNRDVSRALYYRTSRARPQARRLLRQLVKEFPTGGATAMAVYTLERQQIRRHWRRTGVARAVGSSIERLKSVLNSPFIGRGTRRTIGRLIDSAGELTDWRA